MVSIPTGADSAFGAGFGSSAPAGRQAPVPSHGTEALAALLCSAAFTVNSPSELPARSASYTVPESSAIGTGSALYALASQNLPLIRIAIGTSEVLPLSSSRSTATALGPASFFRGAFRSPGWICGRSSCANVIGEAAATHASSVTTAATRRCKLLKNLERPETVGAPVPAGVARSGDCGFAAPAPKVILSGEILMNVNDKAPDFSLQDENGKEVALKDFRGKTVVLYFYPRANTPG